MKYVILVVLAVFVMKFIMMLIGRIYLWHIQGRARNLLPMKVGMYVYAPEWEEEAEEVVGRLKEFGIEVLPLNEELASNLVHHYSWNHQIVTSPQRDELDMVVVGDLRAWGPINGGPLYYRFKIRAYNRYGYEIGMFDFEGSMSKRSLRRLPRIGYLQVLKAVIKLQRCKFRSRNLANIEVRALTSVS